MKYLMILVVFVLSGCGEIEQSISHGKSAWVGLNRTATVYSYTGAPIKTWTFDSQVEFKDGGARFIANGKAVNVNGGILVVEEK